MDVFECIKTRRSVRRFKDVPLELSIIGQLIQAGMDAPSAGNLQNWGFIIVRDPGKKIAIAEACLQQMWIASAPAILVLCTTLDKSKKYYGIRGERLYNIQNCAAAAQNILLAANALGLGACWVGAFEEEMLSRVCGLDKDSRPQVVIPVGYPAVVPEAPSKHIMEKMAFLESWGNRIADIDLLLKYTSKYVQNTIGSAKEIVNKMHTKLKKE